jgi:lysophospholipid acyltransferase (LPLAT)-like uncharacterized protein
MVVRHMLSSRNFTSSRFAQQAIGTAAAHYLRLVWKTTRMIIEPPDIYERIDGDMPIIVAMWHGQHFLMPFIRRPHHRAKVLVSRHRDGEINAVAAEVLGIGTIRGSGTHGADFSQKGGVNAFREILAALEEGHNVALTADVPKVARVVGLGIVKLAQMSGRPIYPIAIATSRRYELDNWDRTTVNLPFGRGGAVAGAPIHVPVDADAATLELARRAVEESLNAVTHRAYELADRSAGGGTGG